MRRGGRAAAAATFAIVVGAAALSMLGGPAAAHAAAPTGQPGTLAQYWDGRAEWTFVRKWRNAELSQTNPQFSATIRVVGSTWYLFNRRIGINVPGCPAGLQYGRMGMQVRSSTDQGATWSAPATVVAPTGIPGDAMACAATDGSAWYNAATNRWHILFQCHEGMTIFAWNGCELERPGASPMGAFTATPSGGSNPVINSGDLWDQICDAPTDDCSVYEGGAGMVGDEGTYDIFQHDGTDYWVAFHGYSQPRGYRGIAKTPDFVNWTAGDLSSGVPRDAIFDKHDAVGWRESWGPGGTIGAGAGSILKEGGHYYQIAEFANGDLDCTSVAKWDWGMFRTTSLTSINWSQPPRTNPFLYNSLQHPSFPECNTVYTSMFKDGATTYLLVGHWSPDVATDGLYLYRLDQNVDASDVPINILENGDFWTANDDGWSVWPSTPIANTAVYRHFDRSPDQSPHLELNCNGSCGTGQSVNQNQPVPNAFRGEAVQFGGKLAVRGGGTGQLLVHLFQFDSSGNPIGSGAGFTATVSGNYANYNGSLTLAANAVSVRFQLYPVTATKTFCLDDLYVSHLNAAPPTVNTSDRSCG